MGSGYFNASDGIDGNERKTILSGMMVRTFQQNGIPELIPKAEINANRGIQVGCHLSECGAQLNLVHFFHAVIDLKIKAPNNRGFTYVITQHRIYPLSEIKCQPLFV
jgi:hypothetical protein